MWNYRRAELIKFGWAQINQVALVISGPFLVISDVPLGEFKMGFVLNIPHTLAAPSCSNTAAAAAGGGGLLAPLLATRALILRTNQRLDALSRPTPPYFGHT